MKIGFVEIKQGLVIDVTKKGSGLFSATFDWKDGYAVLRKAEVPATWRWKVKKAEAKKIVKVINKVALILSAAHPGAYPPMSEYSFRDTILESTRLGKLIK